MTRKRYPLVAALLVLALALTSVQMAAARAAPAPVGQIVICTGTGLATVLVDSDGAPVEHSHICPDGLLVLFASAGGFWTPPEREARWQPVFAPGAGWWGRGASAPGPQARDPPTPI